VAIQKQEKRQTMALTTISEMVEEIKTELEKGVELETIRDNSIQWVDNYVPVYNCYVIEEWQEMPSDYDDRGAEELGTSDKPDEREGIVRLMTLDLYLYYTDLFNEALQEVEDALKEAN
jgi:hypothetical protein